MPYKVPTHFEDLARFSINLVRFCQDLAHFEHDGARICLCPAVISQNGHVLRKNVTKMVTKRQNGRILSENVTK